DRDGAERVRLGEQEGGLLAADPSRHVDVAEVLAHELCELPQDLVARLMAETVVDELEVIEIAEHDRQRRAKRARTHDLAVERLDEAAAIDETGQVVGCRLPLHEVVELRVLECDRRLRREPLRSLSRLLRAAGLRPQQYR